VSGQGERDEAYTSFVSARWASLVRTGFLLTGDRGQAEDLVQSALLRTYQAWARLDAPDNAEAYTRKVLVRLASRARRRRWNGEVPVLDMPEVSSGDPALGVVDSRVVRQALLALPWSQRAVLVLRYLDDRSEAETALALGCSLGTVKSRASRGLAALRSAGLLDVHDPEVPHA
jgi:RNA polymerase sigma-70 factor (sigma-E family)